MHTMLNNISVRYILNKQQQQQQHKKDGNTYLCCSRQSTNIKDKEIEGKKTTFIID